MDKVCDNEGMVLAADDGGWIGLLLTLIGTAVTVGTGVLGYMKHRTDRAFEQRRAQADSELQAAQDAQELERQRYWEMNPQFNTVAYTPDQLRTILSMYPVEPGKPTPALTTWQPVEG